MFRNYLLILIPLFLFACGSDSEKHNEHSEETHEVRDHSEHSKTDAPTTIHYENETNLKNVKQLTFGGDNAEAYFSYDNKNLIFQATNPKWNAACDQIFYMPIEGYGGKKPPLLSTGKGRTTCSYFMPDGKSILYASTHLKNEECPDAPRIVNGKYVWGIFSDFDIFQADLEGNITKQLTDSPGYDAEATISPDGKKIVFTSTRTGDLELYVMDIDGSNLVQVTDELGYDGGAFFSPDNKKLVFRASRPKTEEAIKTYKDLLSKGLVQPTAMELFTCNIDGSDMKQVTSLGGANWGPYYHPSGKKILFCSNHHSESGRQFNIFSVNIDGSDVKQITFDSAFDAFPMFSHDGKKLVFSSNRNNGGTRDTNVFIADWVE
jgi:TolB protein